MTFQHLKFIGYYPIPFTPGDMEALLTQSPSIAEKAGNVIKIINPLEVILSKSGRKGDSK